MEVVADVANDAGHVAVADGIENSDLSFLPKSLTVQCQSLIESYHELHGYACLPDILWKSRLGPFIETHQEFRQLLKKASTTRSAKKSNQGFVRIATTILSLEILASSFAGLERDLSGSGIDRACDSQAKCAQPAYASDGILSISAEIYQRAAIATLAPPTSRQPTEAELYRASSLNSPARSWRSTTSTQSSGDARMAASSGRKSPALDRLIRATPETAGRQRHRVPVRGIGRLSSPLIRELHIHTARIHLKGSFGACRRGRGHREYPKYYYFYIS